MARVLSLCEKAIKFIELDIQHGHIQKDEIINETTISTKLQISRTPVREALIRLQANGILQRVPNKGYIVVELTSKIKNDTYEILAVLDALAATSAISNIDSDDIIKMHEICDKMDIAIKYRNYDEYCVLQENFHDIYIMKCCNATLIKMISALKSGPIKQTYSSNDNMDELFKILEHVQFEHLEIISLFKQKNSTQLELFLKNKHWKTIYPDFI